MAQTKKRRRRKHRGTQGGSIDRRPSRGRPRSRDEAKARARSRGGSSAGRGQRPLNPPTWGGAFLKGAAAAVIFFVLMALIFKRPMAASVALAAFMLVFYVPLSYVTDGFFYRRRVRQAEQARMERAAQRGKKAADS